MIEPIFTDYRKDLVARTLFDLLKIFIAAALASKFFHEFSFPVKMGIGAAMVTLAMLGLVFCPKQPPKGSH